MPFKLLKKVVSIFTLVTFLSTNSIYAAPQSKSIFKNKKVNYQRINDKNEEAIEKKKAILSGEDVKQAATQRKETQKILSSHLSDISLIHIPEEIGRVVDAYQNPNQDNSRLVVHIQDLHTNPEAELNLAKILEILVKDYNLGLVCSEGADGAVDTSSVSSFPDAETREKVAKLFIESGELTGEEYLSITKYPKLAIWGIENKEIYFRNIAEFNSIMKFNPESQVFISQAKKALEELKPRVYSKELLAIIQKESDYENQKAETADYLKYLSSYIQKLNIPTTNYKNVSLLNETVSMESKIDQQKIMQELQGLLMNLQSAIAGESNRSDMDTLMANASLFKDQKISPFSFYSYLKDLADKYLKGQLSKYPNITEFTSYLAKVNSLDSAKLFTEMEDLTYEIKQMLARNDEERKLTQASRNIKFLEGFFNLKVSNEELDYYLQDRDSHKVAFFEAFIKPELQKYNISSFVDFNPAFIDSHLQELEDFYKTAKSRDIEMFNNSISEIEKRNVKVAALVTGGFHTRGLTQLLKDKGYSYIVISPYSKTEIDEENYHFLLSGKRKPIEELIKQLDIPAEKTNKVSVNLRVPLTFNSDPKGRAEDAVSRMGSSRVSGGDAGVVSQKLNIMKGSIQSDQFLAGAIPQGLIKRIEEDPAKQAFVINALYEEVAQYVWTVKNYCERPELAGKKGIIIKDIQENIYPPIFNDLNNISKNIENGDLVPDAVSLKLSEDDKNKIPAINMNTSKRKPRVVFYPMKGDPWQKGHKWCIYKLLGDGADIIITMEDNADPDRKPNLTSLAVREAQSDYLYREVFFPYVKPMKFQRQYRRLFSCDGESIMPTFIHENQEIASKIEWIYDAGYDHCNWTIDGKDGLDVPYKLFFGLRKLFKNGVDVNIIIRLQKREGDSADTKQEAEDKVQAIEAVAKISILQFFIQSLRDEISAAKAAAVKKGKEKEIEFLGGVKAWLDAWEWDHIEEVKKLCKTKGSQDLLEKFYRNGKEALNKQNVKTWRERFKAAAEWEKGRGVKLSRTNDLKDWVRKLRQMSKRSGSFDTNSGEGKSLTDEFSAMVGHVGLSIDIKLEIFDQPMDVNSTRIREEGAVYTVASLPLIDSMLGMRFYPSYRDPETTKSDRKIATEVLGDLIDIKFLRKEANRLILKRILQLTKMRDSVKSLLEGLQRSQQGDQQIEQLREDLKTSGYQALEQLGKEKKEIIATEAFLKRIQDAIEPLLKNLEDDRALLKSKMKDTRLTERVLTDYHLGRYVSASVDMKLLVEKLNQRISNNAFDSALLYRGRRSDKALQTIRKKLKNAYGGALHTVDGYLVKCFIEDDMFNVLQRSVASSQRSGLSTERQARELIDKVRNVVQKRAEQIVKKSREESAATKLAGTVEAPVTESKGSVLGLLYALADNPPKKKWFNVRDVQKNRMNLNREGGERPYSIPIVRKELNDAVTLGLLEKITANRRDLPDRYKIIKPFTRRQIEALAPPIQEKLNRGSIRPEEIGEIRSAIQEVTVRKLASDIGEHAGVASALNHIAVPSRQAL